MKDFLEEEPGSEARAPSCFQAVKELAALRAKEDKVLREHSCPCQGLAPSVLEAQLWL